MLEKLNEFYESHGISPVDFRCKKRQCCSANSPDFTEAKASFVGPLYEKGTALPRLLFLSMDPGCSNPNPQERTTEAVRKWTLECVVAELPKNQHWYLTHEMAVELLRQFEPELTVADTPQYFAHVNSAKCCQNKPGNKGADATLFKNCRPFVPGELCILKPDVIVTQGNPAKEAICCSFHVRKHDVRKMEGAHYETGLIELEPNGKTSLWLHTYHPSYYKGFYPQRAHCWPLYAKRVGRFWRSTTGGSR